MLASRSQQGLVIVLLGLAATHARLGLKQGLGLGAAQCSAGVGGYEGGWAVHRYCPGGGCMHMDGTSWLRAGPLPLDPLDLYMPACMYVCACTCTCMWMHCYLQHVSDMQASGALRDVHVTAPLPTDVFVPHCSYCGRSMRIAPHDAGQRAWHSTQLVQEWPAADLGVARVGFRLGAASLE